MNHAVLIALGDELLSGLRQEGNCRWLAEKLTRAGWNVDKIEILSDGGSDLEESLRTLAGKVDLLVLSGGLGPTHDDCTRIALSRYLSVPLAEDRRAYDAVLARYPEESRAGLERSRGAQSAIPLGARGIHNPSGSALGIAFTVRGTRVFAFPGVPAEFRAMAEQELAADILMNDLRMTSVFVAGWPENLLKDRLAPITEQKDLHISILPSAGLIEFVLRGEPDRLVQAETQVRCLLPGDCLPPGTSSLQEAVHFESKKRNLTLSCAESCTGGLVGAALTEIPGSSEVFLGSAVCYSNQAKKSILSVSQEILDSFGAVSSQCALSMAEGARRIYGSDLSLSVTGIAGPEGGTEEKSVGTVWFSTYGLGIEEATLRRFSGNRRAVREKALMAGLEMLWRRISKEG
ncbi:MAG: nicotinamide-nucleotide amidohydrolase family protein [Synergistaceae bacterium]|nr:nicotinamide-nucleotide amidohydrolase family protein [Synergistaceae bacterium]